MHIVGVYSISSFSLYVDARLVATKALSPEFKFTNTSISLTSGPTSSALDSFVFDAPAVYRYSLSPQSILNHYNAGSVSASAIQIVAPDEGVLFSGTDASIRAQFQYSYPINRRWTEFLDENTYYDENAGYISFYKTADGHLARGKGGIEASRIANDPAFQRTRENGAEFGKAGSGGKVLRNAIRYLLENAKDKRVVSRLTTDLLKVVKTDTVNARGERTIQDGNFALMENFDFNKNAKLGATLFTPDILEEPTPIVPFSAINIILLSG